MSAGSKRAFRLRDLAAVVLVITLVLAFFIPTRRKLALRTQCSKNLHDIGVAFKLFNQGPQYQMRAPANEFGTLNAVETGEVFRHFQVMSNELRTAEVVVCPADIRRPAKAFTYGFSNANVSYFIGVDASDNFPEMFLCGDRNLTNGPLRPNKTLALTTNTVIGWNEQMHNREGNVLLCDGSVQLFDTPRLRWYLRKWGLPGQTNRLAVPE